MKEYIKPSITIVEFETGTDILAASGEPTTPVYPTDQNSSNRAKESTFDFNVWGTDEELD